MLLNYLSITEDGHLIPLRKCSGSAYSARAVLRFGHLEGHGEMTYILLRPPGKTVATQMVIARFLQDDFELTLNLLPMFPRRPI